MDRTTLPALILIGVILALIVMMGDDGRKGCDRKRGTVARRLPRSAAVARALRLF